MSSSLPAKPRILIAEDVNIIAMVMTRALEKEGFAVSLARDGAECLRMALEMIPDLVVLDLMLPKMSGIEVLKAIRAIPATQDIPVVICSAKDFKEEREEAVSLGADYLIKSSSPSVLVEKVQTMLCEHQRSA